MKQIFLTGDGQVAVLDVPVPGRLANTILVKNAFSVISTGTETAALLNYNGWLGIIEKASRSRDKAKQVWEMAQSQGIKTTWRIVNEKLKDYKMPGYSCSGQVVETDNNNTEFKPGDLVACMGAGFANHSEYVVVPINLAVKLPKKIKCEEAAFGAIACIAQQGIRLLELSPGEEIVILGLGLIGTMAFLLAKAMGYKVYGADISIARVEMARSLSGAQAWELNKTDIVREVFRLTKGHGADGVLICASTKSSHPVNLAFELCRPKGKVSVIGDVGLNLQRSKMYRKELSLRMSCSYGPGRYDPAYELKGIDYPYSHIRWTERRNLEYFIHLLEGEKIDLKPLISKKYKISKAAEAYTFIKKNNSDVYGVLFDYGPLPEKPEAIDPKNNILRASIIMKTVKDHKINLGLIGVGGYAKGVHVPNLKKLAKEYKIHGIASRSGATAAVVAKSTGATIVTSDYKKLIEDPEIDAVLIATRHASHAHIVLDALNKGKHVFVEKPMATTIADAKKIEALARQTGLVVRVGFNRRFSPYLSNMRRVIGICGERIFTARVNVGAQENHWSNTPEEGGRLLGEGVHFFDLCNWFMGAMPTSVYALFAGEVKITNPNATVLLHYPDGSSAQVLYTSTGHSSMGKEYFEAFGNTRAVRVDNYKSLAAFGVSASVSRRERGNKGQLSALEEFAAAIHGNDYGLNGADAYAGLFATWIALAAYQSARENKVIKLEF